MPRTVDTAIHLGIRNPDGSPRAGSPVTYQGDGHLITVAPTRSGKGRGCIVPNLLSYEGNAVVVDPKGENYSITAVRRREMGQRVVLLDPFYHVPDDPDVLAERRRFNPLDAIDHRDGVNFVDDCVTLATMIVPDADDPRAAHYEDRCREFLSALIAFVAEHGVADPAEAHEGLPTRHLGFVERLVMTDKAQATWILDMMRSTNTGDGMVAAVAAAFAGLPEEERAAIVSRLARHLIFLRTPSIKHCLERSEFDLGGLVTEGADNGYTIYIVFPPERLASHRQLLRLWFAALAAPFIRSPGRRGETMLFIDEAAQLGRIEHMRIFHTLTAGYGLRCWSFWQDLSQLRSLYPDWETIVNNCDVRQAFGLRTRQQAEDAARLCSVPDAIAPGLVELPRDDEVVHISGAKPLICARLDHFRDEPWCGLNKGLNPFHEGGALLRRATRRRRVFETARPDFSENAYRPSRDYVTELDIARLFRRAGADAP